MFSWQHVEQTTGFTVFSSQHVENTLVLKTGPPKLLKNYWFYSKTSPGHRRATVKLPIRGLAHQYSPGDIMRNPYSQAA